MVKHNICIRRVGLIIGFVVWFAVPFLEHEIINAFIMILQLLTLAVPPWQIMQWRSIGNDGKV